jgi:hypothetical protein
MLLGPDDVLEAESDANDIMQLAGVFPEAPVHIRELYQRLEINIENSFGVRVAHRREADIVRVGTQWTAHLLMRMTEPRENYSLAHELGHWLDRSRGRPDRCEAYYNAVGACLVATRPTFVDATRILGHRVHELAAHFQTMQALTLLRLGEVTGRPVLLPGKRRGDDLVRGDPFEWGPDPARLPRDVAHPIRVDGRMAYMVDRGWLMAA